MFSVAEGGCAQAKFPAPTPNGVKIWGNGQLPGEMEEASLLAEGQHTKGLHTEKNTY